MSRIFDALQRSGVEQAGVEYPDVISVITEIFESPKEAVPAPSEPERKAAELDLSTLKLPVEQLVTKRPASQELKEAVAAPSEPVRKAAELDLSTLNLPVEQLDTKKPGQELGEFPSLNVSMTSNSRLVFFTEPDSLAAEKFRFLGVRLRQIQQNRSLKKVLVTSTIPEEGKSFVSANLAGVLARRKQKVLLIEGDLRRPTISKIFGLGKLVGLGEWLQGDHRKPMNIYRLDGTDLWLMPAGDPPANPLELMQSGRLSQLMEQLSTMFDWIIVDSPPLLPLADTTVWERTTEGTLLVVREGKTEKAMLERGLQTVKKSALLGVVLNGCANTHQSYYQRYAAGPGK